MQRHQWVLLAYRLPRQPSTARVAVWRKLRRLGVVQVTDGLVGLPFDARTKEQLEWLADEVTEAGGEASIWVAEPATAAHERALAAQMSDAVAQEYRAVTDQARAAETDTAVVRRRTLARLRRELRRVEARDYFPSAARKEARLAVADLGRLAEVETEVDA